MLNCNLKRSKCGFCIFIIFWFSIIEYMHFGYTCLQVSPTYSREVAGNPAVAPYLYKFHGIINGIDPDIWDPYNDNFIPVSWYMPISFFFFSFLFLHNYNQWHAHSYQTHAQNGNRLRSNAYISYTTHVGKNTDKLFYLHF